MRLAAANWPSRPYDSGMAVLDRPTISGQFLGQFHAHGLPNKWKMPSIYRDFGARPGRTRRSARREIFSEQLEAEIFIRGP
jgi:hypothetical protein